MYGMKGNPPILGNVDGVLREIVYQLQLEVDFAAVGPSAHGVSFNPNKANTSYFARGSSALRMVWRKERVSTFCLAR